MMHLPGLLILGWISLQAPVELQVDTFSFQEGSLHGEGGVMIETDLAHIQSDEALFDQNQGALLSLMGHVSIETKEGGQLCCEVAKGSKEQQSIEFGGDSGVWLRQPGDKGALQLSCRQLTTYFESDHEQMTALRDIVAEYDVDLDQEGGFRAKADKAVWHAPAMKSDNKKGLITLSPIGSGGICCIEKGELDRIDARQIFYDQQIDRLLIDHPIGLIHPPMDAETFPLHFSAGLLTWDREQGILNLSDLVLVEVKGKLRVEAEEGVTFFQGQGALDSLDIDGIVVAGPSIWKVTDSEERLHTLLCYGSAELDPAAQVARLDTPPGMHKKQIHVQNDFGEMYADHAKISYQDEHDWMLKAVEVEGDVRIVTRSTPDPEVAPRLMRYALADRAIYDPKQQLVKLLADEGERILFYDCINHMQVSAPAVHIQRDETSGQMRYQGIGDVRLAFGEKERNRFEHNFPLLAQELAGLESKKPDLER